MSALPAQRFYTGATVLDLFRRSEMRLIQTNSVFGGATRVGLNATSAVTEKVM
jgi:hypothetical protein